MNLSETLHPHLDADRQLLILELDHGKANEMGTAQLDAFDELCAWIEDPARTQPITCLCTTSRRVSGSGKPIFIAGANVTERAGWDDARVWEPKVVFVDERNRPKDRHGAERPGQGDLPQVVWQ